MGALYNDVAKTGCIWAALAALAVAWLLLANVPRGG